jgi:pyocin large subunit-like protein
MKALSFVTVAALAVTGLLAACDGGPSAVATVGSPSTASGQGLAATPVSTAPVPLINGRPMWAANRRHSAQDNAAYQFRRNGHDFGSASEDQYVAAAHAFIAHPPAGVQTITRPNGDRLIYDPAANTFAVVTSAGAPRTLFKPRTGAAYWTQQQQRAARDTAQAASGGGSGAGGSDQAG